MLLTPRASHSPMRCPALPAAAMLTARHFWSSGQRRPPYVADVVLAAQPDATSCSRQAVWEMGASSAGTMAARRNCITPAGLRVNLGLAHTLKRRTTPGTAPLQPPIRGVRAHEHLCPLRRMRTASAKTCFVPAVCSHIPLAAH